MHSWMFWAPVSMEIVLHLVVKRLKSYKVAKGTTLGRSGQVQARATKRMCSLAVVGSSCVYGKDALWDIGPQHPWPRTAARTPENNAHRWSGLEDATETQWQKWLQKALQRLELQNRKRWSVSGRGRRKSCMHSGSVVSWGSASCSASQSACRGLQETRMGNC